MADDVGHGTRSLTSGHYWMRTRRAVLFNMLLGVVNRLREQCWEIRMVGETRAVTGLASATQTVREKMGLASATRTVREKTGLAPEQSEASFG